MTNFTYTRGQLELLAQCMELNPNLSDALFVFFDTAKLEPNCAETLNWLRHAEGIKFDSKYIERTCFPANANQVVVEQVGYHDQDGKRVFSVRC